MIVSVTGMLVLALLQSLPAQRQAPCSNAAAPADAAVAELCAGQDAVRRAPPTASPERTRSLQTAADHFRRAADQSRAPEITATALDQLATVYDSKHLNEPPVMEQVLRELIAVNPNDLAPVFRLALVQERWGLIEAAEGTLLDARHRQPEAIEPNRQLAQFFARRVTALNTAQPPPETVTSPGERDERGIYRIGGNVKPPRREGTPEYPEQARAAGIKGVVITEIVVDAAGSVVDARVVRSIPMLDDAALAAVRTRKFQPTIVDGQPVPVRIVVTVNFVQ